MLHSKSTYFYRWSSRYISIAPIACALTLLVGIGLFLNPAAKAQEVYAAENENECKTTSDEYGICAMELAIFMNGTDAAYNELPATELSADSVVHRDYNFSVRAVDTKDGYDLYAGVVNTGNFGNNLVNADYPTEEHMIKALSGTDVAYNNIGNNEWGYALTSTSQNAEELSYNSLPVATITTENDKTTLTNGKLLVHGEDTGYDPSQPVGEDRHTDQDYKLYFAAKASPESPSGHYRTQVMLSLVANPKEISGLTTITKMSELTSETCARTKTPNAFLDDGTTINTNAPTKQLIDDRENATTGTKYWVSKLADGNCWMTQNMAYGNGTNGQYKDRVLDNGKAVSFGSRKPSSDPNATTTFPNSTTYNAHLRIGPYYTQHTSILSQQASLACDFSSKNNNDWTLPLKMASSSDNPFITLLNKYNIRSADEASTRAPLYLIWSGKANGGNEYNISDIGTAGSYWAGEPTESSTLVLYTSSSLLEIRDYSSIYGASVRCLVSGN